MPSGPSVDLKFVHSPIVDLGLPSIEALDRLLADLEGRLTAGEKLYIHCWWVGYLLDRLYGGLFVL